MRPAVTRPSDTDPEAERVQLDLLRAATPARRAALAISLTATTIGLSRRALERRSPEASAADIDLRFVELNDGGDVLGVLRISMGEIDREYLGRWAAEIGVADLLERALAETGAR